MRWFHSFLLLASAVLALPPPLRAGEDPPLPPVAVPDRPAELRALQEANGAGRHGEAIRRAEECLLWLDDARWRVFAARVAVQGTFETGDMVGCLRWCGVMDRELEAAEREGTRLAEERGYRSALGGYALLRLGRLEEAAEELVLALSRRPEYRSDLGMREALAVARAEGDFWVDANYRGKYEEDPRLPDALRGLRDAIPRALDRLRVRLGVESLGLPPIVVVLVDAAMLPGAEHGGLMTVKRVKVTVTSRAILFVTAEPLLAGVSDPVTGIAHELVHLLQIRAWDGEEALPWMWEGLAYRLSRAGDGDLEDMVLSVTAQFRENPRGEEAPAPAPVSVNGSLESRATLEARDEFLQRVAGSVLFHQVEILLGEERFRKLALDLLRSPDAVPVLEKAAGGTIDELLPRVRKGYLEWTGNCLSPPAGLEEVNAMGRKGNLARALELLDALPADPEKEGGRP